MSNRFSLAEAIKDAEKEGLVGGGVWKPQEGANRIRLVAGLLPNPETYTDRKTGKTEKRFKWLAYVIVHDEKGQPTDGLVKPYFMPHSIAKLLRDLQEDEDYAFDTMPMPYDIVLKATGAGTRDVEYSVIAKARTLLTPDESNALDAKQPIAEYRRELREKRGEGERFDPDEIPA